MDSIIIYNSIGTVLYENIPVTSSAESVQELMRSDYIQLSWNSATNETIPAGAYIIYGTEHYSLLEPYSPDQKNEREWTYRPQFQSRFMGYSKVPFFMYTTISGVTTKEADWVLTDNPVNFMRALTTAILNETGDKYKFAVDNNLQITSATLEFNCVDIVSASSQIANAFGTELWLEKFSGPDGDGAIGVLHLSMAFTNYDGSSRLREQERRLVQTVAPESKHILLKDGAADYIDNGSVILKVGDNIKVPSITKNGEYFNRFYIFGSSRNIPQDYQGANVNNVATKRLTLAPSDYPDGYMNFSNGGPVYSKIIQFDDIYPSATDLVITSVRQRLMYEQDDEGHKVVIGEEEGQPIYSRYAIWYVQLKRKIGSTYLDFDFDNTDYDKDENPGGMLLPGLVPSFHFNDGALNGREFEVIYHEKAEVIPQDAIGNLPFEVHEGDFEIKFVKESTGGLILPAVTGLVPNDDDKVVLFNVRMPSEYVDDAQDRLEEAALAEINKNYLNTDTLEPVDKNEYQAASDPTVFYEKMPDLSLGTAIKYINGNYVKTSRVIGLTKRLDLPCYQTITFGDSYAVGNIEELKEEAVSANKDIDLLAALNKTSSELSAAFERTRQLLLNQISDVGSIWIKEEYKEGDVKKYRAKLNPNLTGAYTNGFLAAGGIGSNSGGGGGSIDLDRVWESLTNNTDKPDVEIHTAHIPDIPISKVAGLADALAQAGRVQSVVGQTGDITVGQIASALNSIGYLTGITSSMVTNALGYTPLAASALTGYATETWVQGNYLALSGGTLTGDLRLKTGGNNYGSTLRFGDGDYAYLAEDEDDHLSIYASNGLTFITGSAYGIKYGNGVLKWDANNDAWHLEGNFYADGFISAGGVASSSDRRLKDKIEDVCSDRALAVMMALRPKEWVWNEKNDYFSGKRGAGLVAQDVEDVLPFAVMETGEYKSLNYSVLHAYEIAGLQNHEERIAELEKENKKLKEKLEAYAAR